MTALAQARLVEAADADARTEDCAKIGIHAESIAHRVGRCARRKDYFTFNSLTSKITAWPGPISALGPSP
jgi:hypothetical protein